MTTAAAKPSAIDQPPTAAPRSRRARRRPLALASLMLTLALVAFGAWVAVDRLAANSGTTASSATPAPAGTSVAMSWLRRLEVIHLERRLVRAGYSLKVDGRLDPVTRSALADFLQPSPAHPLSPFLAVALGRTAITGLRNPGAWNSRFGLERATKFVERPLTGPGGQLDVRGNLRAPVAATAAPLSAEVARPRNGKIAFVDRMDNLDVLNPNGSGLRRLARCPATITSCGITGYAWSPNGKQLAFLRGYMGGPTPNNLSLYVINAGGSAARFLAYCGDCRARLAWSPDSSSIVFARRDGLNMVSLRTGAQRRLTDSWLDGDPVWSPSGSRIAFGRGNLLYTVKPDGSGIAELAAVGGTIDHPDWAPDGTRIVFDGPDQIYAVGADGSQLKLLRNGSLGNGPGTPSWSPDGGRILFFNTPGTSGAFTPEVWVMKPDGSDPRRLYHLPCCVDSWHPPLWSPDGKSIVVSADSCSRDCRFARRAGGIVSMDRNGQHRRRLSRSESEIAWQPIPRSW